jgi:hypothetical protein
LRQRLFGKNGAPERPQTLRCSKIKKNLSSEDAQSECGAHSNRPATKEAAAQIFAQLPLAFCGG